MTGAGAFSTEDLTLALLVGALVLVVSIGAVRLATTSGFPTLLLYLGIGLVVGEGLGLHLDSPMLARVLGYVALILILTEGGLRTQWSSIRRSVVPAFSLSTVGVVVSVLVAAAAAHWVLGMDWGTALMVGAILSSTDAAAVFSVLRRVPLPRRITGMLEAESGFNDAPVVILVTALAVATVDPAGAMPWWQIGLLAMVELTGGALVGLAVGWLGGRVVRRLATGTSGLFAIAVIAVSLLAYATAAVAHLSGFIACYLASLVLGNMRLPHRHAINGFAEGVGWLAQIGLFVMLGMLATPSGFLEQIPNALLLGLVLLLVARPLSVLVSLTPFRVPWRDQAFLSWAGLRGAVPIVLATVPLTEQSPRQEWIFDLVFMLVVIFTLVQAPLLPSIARRLRVVEEGQATEIDVESVPLERLGADLLEVQVTAGSRLAGVEVVELRLPKGANVALVVRDEAAFVPGPRTLLRKGDELLVVATAQVRDQVEERLRAVSRDGRLAGWVRPSAYHRRDV